MHHHPVTRRLATAVLAGGIGLCPFAAASAPAAASTAQSSAHGSSSSTPKASTSAQAAAGYLARSLQGSRHDHYELSYVSGGKTHSYAGYGETADAVVSMDAAGVAQAAASRATAYLEKHVSDYVVGNPTDYPGAAGKLLLVAEAQHVDVHDFGGTDLVTAITDSEGAGGAASGEYQQNPGFTGSSTIVSQSLPVLALAGTTRAAGQPDAAAVSFLAAQQCADGGFATDVRDDTTTACGDEDVDSTGYAVQALIATGNHAAADAGLHWLSSKGQNGDGGYGDAGVSNGNSTALAVQALVMGHRGVTKGERWLRGHQVGCGHAAAHQGAVTYEGSYDASALQSTTQAGAALARAPLAWVDSSGSTSGRPALSCGKR